MKATVAYLLLQQLCCLELRGPADLWNLSEAYFLHFPAENQHENQIICERSILLVLVLVHSCSHSLPGFTWEHMSRPPKVRRLDLLSLLHGE